MCLCLGVVAKALGNEGAGVKPNAPAMYARTDAPTPPTPRAHHVSITTAVQVALLKGMRPERHGAALEISSVDGFQVGWDTECKESSITFFLTSLAAWTGDRWVDGGLRGRNVG